MLEDRLDLETEIRELFIAKFKEFAKFCAEMQVTQADIEKDDWAQDLSEEYLKGYNAGLTDGVETALSLWTEENGY